MLLSTLGVFCSWYLSLTTELLPEDLPCVTGAFFTLAREKSKKPTVSPPFKALMGSLKAVCFSGCFWWPFGLWESRCCSWSLYVTVALFSFYLSFFKHVGQAAAGTVQYSWEALIYAGTRLCSGITGYWMLYAVLISFYDQRTQPEFLKYGMYERLIHVSFKGPLYLCLAKLLGWAACSAFAS